MRIRSGLAALLAAALLIAGCGSHGSTSHHPAAQPCPPNRSYMGCAQHSTGLRLSLGLAAPSGPLFPDVSMWQGAVNWGNVAAWQRAHGWKPAAIFKLGEYTLDPQAGRNAQQTASQKFWRAGYWFVRNTGCAHEGSLIVWAAKRYGLKVVALDEEVPEARGYDVCLTAAVKAAGLIPVTYTAPGTWPGGSSAGNPAWEATYGPGFGCLAWTCRPVAWQFTDGVYGAVVDIPGIGRDDVSVDYGLTRLGVPPKPHPAVLPVCVHRRMSRAQCSALKGKIASDNRAAIASWAAWHRLDCPRYLRRRNGQWVGVGPYVRLGCGVFAQRAHYFTGKARSIEQDL